MYLWNKSKNARLFGLFSLFALSLLIEAGIGKRLLEIPLGDWMLIGLAASLAGQAISYMTIGEWIRAPFTNIGKHSDIGEDVHPACESGLYSALCELVACPICSGVWAAAAMLFGYTYLPEIAKPFIWVVSAGSLAMMLTYAKQNLEWGAHAERAMTGYYNRLNIEHDKKNRRWINTSQYPDTKPGDTIELDLKVYKIIEVRNSSPVYDTLLIEPYMGADQ